MMPLKGYINGILLPALYILLLFLPIFKKFEHKNQILLYNTINNNKLY